MGRGIDDRAGEMAAGDDQVDGARVVAEAREHAAEREVLDLQAVPPVCFGSDEVVPLGRRADGSEARPARCGKLERARGRELVRAVADRLDDDEVAADAVVHTRDPPAEVEIRLNAVEGGVVGRGDEDRVGAAVGLPRRLGQRVAVTRESFPSERQVDVVEVEGMQARDFGEYPRGLGHQLGAHAVAGQAGHCP